jgi:hypothetical protein
MLASAPTAPSRGSRLEVEHAESGLVLRLYQDERLAGSTTAKPGANDTLRFVRRPVGNDVINLRVALGNSVVFNETIKDAPSSTHAQTRAGVQARELKELDWEKVRATTSNVVDYSFTSAPVDWRAGAGDGMSVSAGRVHRSGDSSRAAIRLHPRCGVALPRVVTGRWKLIWPHRWT